MFLFNPNLISTVNSILQYLYFWPISYILHLICVIVINQTMTLSTYIFLKIIVESVFLQHYSI